MAAGSCPAASRRRAGAFCAAVFAVVVLAGCGSSSHTAKTPARVTRVTWYVRGEIDITEKYGSTPALTRVACRAGRGRWVSCFIEFADNRCGRGMFRVVGLKVEGVLHAHDCAPAKRPAS